MSFDMSVGVDYRVQNALRAAEGGAWEPPFLTPLDDRSSALLLDRFRRACPRAPAPVSVPVMMGRQLSVSGVPGAACLASFAALCEDEKSAADYLALCKHFHTVFLLGAPCPACSRVWRGSSGR